MNTKYLPRYAIGLVLSLLSVGHALALPVDGTWKQGRGSGNWHDSTNWVGDPSPVPGGAGSVINLTTGNGASPWITIDGSVASRTVGILNFGSSTGTTTWTIYTANSGTLTFDNSGSDAEINVGAMAGSTTRIRASIILNSSLIINNDNAAKEFILGTSAAGFTISGTGGITKEGVGILTLATLANSLTYTGDTVINGGTLRLLGQAFDGASTNNHVYLNNGSTLESSFGNLSFGGGLTVSNGIVNAPVSNLFFDNQTITVNQGAIHANIKDGGVTNKASVSKVGPGTFELTGTNIYTGDTTITGGRLVISSTGSINGTAGTVIINGGDLRYNSTTNLNKAVTFTTGALSGTNWNGTLNNLTIGTGQTINPGNSPGTATTTNQTWAAGGTYAWEINDATGTAGADSGWDLLNGVGTLNITATAGNEFTLKVMSLTLANTPGDAANFDDTLDYTWRIADFANAITFNTTNFNIDTSTFSNAFTGAFSLHRGDESQITGGDNTQLWLAYTAIPEPSVWMLLAIGLGALALRRGRRVS